MFEAYRNDLRKNQKEHKMVDITVSSNINVNHNLFQHQLNHLDSRKDEEIMYLVKTKYTEIFTREFIAENPKSLNILTDKRFLFAAIQVFNSVPIEYTNKIYANKLAYDYIKTHIEDEHEYTRNLMYSLARAVNKDIIPRLLALGIPESITLNLVIARYSSIKETVNCARLNYCIATSDRNLMTEQMIIRIYEILFDELTILFESIMFSEYDQSQDDLIYSTISLAILDILSSQTSIVIRRVLMTYAADYASGLFRRKIPTPQGIILGDTFIRFSINAISSDYQRILDVSDRLASEEGIYVP